NFPSRPMPAYIALSSRKKPRATVSGGRGRALCPLAKNWLSESGLVFAWSYISLRHAKRERASIAAPSALGVDIGHLHRLDAQKKEMGSLAIELRIARLEAEEIAVARCEREAANVEDRVVRLRKAVQDEDAGDGGEHGAEDRALERDRDERGPRIE